MPLESISKSIYETLGATTYTVSVGMRNAGTPTPCMVYELTSATLDAQMRGVVANRNHWIISVEVACIADTVETVTQMADSVAGLWALGTIVDAGNDCKLMMSEMSVAFSAETPDDGQQDAERIATITMTILASET
ncbi:MAG: hypothetical protein ACOYLQ_19230 [Hyphomicrobiaceae bacterium]